MPTSPRRIEVVRGPQSALWGSEAIGGVIAVNGDRRRSAVRSAVGSEAGSFGFGARSASGSLAEDEDRSLSLRRRLAARDGHRRLRRQRRQGRLSQPLGPSSRRPGRLAPAIRLGASGFALSGRSEFDGFDPVTFAPCRYARQQPQPARGRAPLGRVRRTDSALERAHRRLAPLARATAISSTDDEINRTSGRRATLDAQLQRQFKTAAIEHRLILALDHESEEFKASDVNFGGATNQDRDRKHSSLTFEWRADAGPVTADLASAPRRLQPLQGRHDGCAHRCWPTSVSGFSIAASYGEGIAQPTFFDLYGFFPDSFVGNPSLKPERSRGFEASLRYRKDSFGASADRLPPAPARRDRRRLRSRHLPLQHGEPVGAKPPFRDRGRRSTMRSATSCACPPITPI